MICFDPVEVWFPQDADKPPEKRPTFVVRGLSYREEAAFARLRKDIGALYTEQDKADEALEKLETLLAMFVVQTRNVVNAELTKLVDVLSPQEVNALIEIWRDATALGEVDLKKSRAPSASDLPTHTGTGTNGTGAAAGSTREYAASASTA